MMKILSLDKVLSFIKLKWIPISIIASLLVGFFLGMEYKSYQIKRSFQEIGESFSQIFSDSLNSNDGQAKEANVLTTEEKNSYIPKLDVSVNVEEYESFLSSENKYNGKSRKLTGTIKNNGDKEIKKAQLLVMFLDEQGQSIYENTYNPLYNPDQYDEVILKPNYINEFAFNTDGAPKEWSGKIKYQINDLEY